MPVLKNQRHERFAQELAKGQSASAAYAASGYKPHQGNASTLRSNQEILDRVVELQGQMAERTIEKTAITRDKVIAELARIAFADISMDDAQIKDKRAALVNIAQIEGMIVEKHEHGRAGDFANLPEAELARLLAEQARILGFKSPAALIDALQGGVTIEGAAED